MSQPPLIQWRTLALGALSVTASAHYVAAQAYDSPPANKIIAFVRTDDCQLEAIKPRVNAAGEALVKDKTTTWVAVDLPANPGRNVSMLGKPSPYIAAVEADAATSALPRLTKQVRRALGTQCHVDVYSIHEGRVITPGRTWKLGEPSPVGKGFITFYRADGISLKTLDTIWGGPHAELILSNRDRAVQSGQPLQGESYLYIRNVVVGRADKSSPSIDGIAETGGSVDRPGSGPSAAPAQGGPPPAANRNQESARRFMRVDIHRIEMFSVEEVILKD
jgi:hypothetical protein